MRKTLTISDCDTFAESKGGKCKTRIYVNNHTKMEWECLAQHLWEAAFSDLDRKSVV